MSDSPPPNDTPRVVLLLIGNELLSGEIADRNLPLVSRRLFEWGAMLEYVHVIRDERTLIAREVRQALERADWVMTTGGIGATPDDVTRAAVAEALELPLERHPEAESEVRAYYGEHLNDVRLSLANLPRGAQIIRNPINRIPTFRCGRVIVLPGVPSLVEAMLPALQPVLSGTPFHRTEIETPLGESLLVPALIEGERRFPKVSFGSYPEVETRLISVRLVLRSKDGEQLAAAREWLIGEVRRIEAEHRRER